MRRFLPLLCAVLAAAHAPRPPARSAAPSAPPVVSVALFGARGDGQSDDTAAIQAAIEAVPPGGTLHFPPGTYRVATETGVRLKGDMHVDLGHAILVGANRDGARCRLIEIQGRSNVTISGGTLVGSRSGSPEWGVGILASDTENLVIENVTLRDFYFDGILLTGNRGCRRVVVRGCVAENNRRTGLSIPSAAGVTVEASTFNGTRGQSPEAGINCEPGPGAEVSDVHVTGSTFSGNAGVGFYAHKALGVSVSAIVVENSTLTGNSQGIVLSDVDGGSVRGNRVVAHAGRGKSGIALGNLTTRVVVADNQLDQNFRGIMAAGALGVEIRNNRINGTGVRAGESGEDGDGIVCRGLRALVANACIVTGNIVRGVAGSGIVAQLVARVQVLDNEVSETGRRGVYLQSVVDSEVTGNRLASSGLETPGLYDAIALAQSANDNLVAQNTCRLGPATKAGIGIGLGCRDNRVFGNVVVPWDGESADSGPTAGLWQGGRP
jgi:parallel beta-helix repeat protein